MGTICGPCEIYSVRNTLGKIRFRSNIEKEMRIWQKNL